MLLLYALMLLCSTWVYTVLTFWQGQWNAIQTDVTRPAVLDKGSTCQHIVRVCRKDKRSAKAREGKEIKRKHVREKDKEGGRRKVLIKTSECSLLPATFTQSGIPSVKPHQYLTTPINKPPACFFPLQWPHMPLTRALPCSPGLLEMSI